MSRSTAVASIALLLAGLGCAAQSPRVSTEVRSNEPMVRADSARACTVYFKRDLLGGTSPAPIPILSTNHNGANIALSGRLISTEGEWIVLRGGREEEYRIPKNNVLFLQIEPR